MLCLDECRVLYSIPRKLGERLAVFVDTLSLHFEMTLLRHASVPATSYL